MYTDEEVQAVSDVLVTGGGNNRLDAAIAKPVRRFRDRWKQAVAARLNELFTDADFAPDQRQSWVEAVLRWMLSNETLVAQAKANTPAQFLGSPDLKDAVTEVVMDNQTALSKMADVYYADERIR